MDYTLAVGKHNPKVYEVEETLLEIPREARQHGDKYEPYIYSYNKASQLDLQKLRYSQQQKVDLRNLQMILKRFQSEGKDRAHNISESGKIPVRRRRIVRPKFDAANQNGFLIDRLIEMQGKYGKKEINRAPRIRMEKDDHHKNGPRNENSKNDHVAAESDLEAAGSEIEDVRTQIERQDEISAILTKALVPNPQSVSVQPATIVDTLGKDVPPNIVRDLSVAVNNHKDGALYSLLQKSIAQADSSKQSSGSQPLLITVPNSESQISLSVEPYSTNTGIQLEQNNILKSNGPDLEQIQAQLDIISQKEGEKAIAEAQQKALDYVESQKKAIERAETEARKLAIATINAHNLQLTKALPQNIALTRPQLTAEHVQRTQDILPKQQEILHLATSNNKEVKAYEEIPTQTYFQLLSPAVTAKPPGDVSKDLDASIRNEYALIYPEINYNGVSGINNIGQNFKIENIPLTKLLAEAYEKSAAVTYSQPPEDLQKKQLRLENGSSREKIEQNGYDVSNNVYYVHLFSSFSKRNCCKYLYIKQSERSRYRIKREINNETTMSINSDDYDYSDADLENTTLSNSRNYTSVDENLPLPEKLMYTADSVYDADDVSYHEDGDDYYGDFEGNEKGDIKAISSNNRHSRFRYYPSRPSHHQHHKHYPYHDPKKREKPAVSFIKNNLNTIKKEIVPKDGGNPTVILINNNNEIRDSNKHIPKHGHRARKRPTYRKTNFRKLESKIRKALINVAKFRSRYHL